MNSSYLQATNALGSLLSCKVYTLIRDKLCSLSMDTFARYTQLHSQYALNPCATQIELDQFQRDKDVIFRVYKDSLLQLSASAELLDKISDNSINLASHASEDQVPEVVKEIMELLTSSVTESKTTMDHLIELKETDQQIRADMGIINEKLAKIRDLKE